MSINNEPPMSTPKNAFGQIATLTTFTVKPSDRARFVELTLQLCEESLRHEPHTLQMEILLPPDEASGVVLFGIFLDKAAFADHLKGACVKKHFKNSGSLVMHATVVQYVIAS